ncbi:MAG: hypothetical protein HWN67_19240 [Candidatus Helarchaeota archaeon]|nr:hypothetical protein [Candidatus Helarchaeota archaeon]
MDEKLEVLAKILIGGLITGIGIVLLGGIWFFLDLIQPTGKAGSFLAGSTGMQILVIAAALLAIFFLIIIFSTIWKKGYDYILDKLES